MIYRYKTPANIPLHKKVDRTKPSTPPRDMYTKNQLRDAITAALEDRDVEDAEEVADSVVEVLDEEGAFESASDED